MPKIKKVITDIVSHKWFDKASIFITWLLTIFPTIINSKWFFLDDPETLRSGILVSQNLNYFIPTSIFGRYVPAYWYYRGMIFRLFGYNTEASYVIQSLWILLSLILIYWIVRSLTKNRFAGLAAMLIFITGSGIAESAYTLGKPEPIVLVSTLIVIASVIRLISTKIQKVNIIYFVLIILFITFAVWNKEPSLVIVLLGVGLFVGGSGWKRKNKSYLIASLSIIIGGVVSRLPQLIFRPNNLNSSYTDYPINASLIKSNLTIYSKQNTDFIILIIIVTILLILFFYKQFKHKDESQKLKIIITTSLYIISVIYFAILIIWRWPMGYYLYVALGLLSIVFVVVTVEYTRELKKYGFKIILFLFVLIGLTRFVSIPYNLYIAKTQYTFNSIYTDSIVAFKNEASDNSKLFIENWDFYGEEVSETNVLLNNIYGRNDLKVSGIADLVENRKITNDVLKLYGWSQAPDPKTRWPQKNDYVLVYVANVTTFWRVRGIMPIVKNDSNLFNKGYTLELVSQSIENYRLPFLESTANGTNWKFNSTFLGYKLYKVINVPERLE